MFLNQHLALSNKHTADSLQRVSQERDQLLTERTRGNVERERLSQTNGALEQELTALRAAHATMSTSHTALNASHETLQRELRTVEAEATFLRSRAPTVENKKRYCPICTQRSDRWRAGLPNPKQCDPLFCRIRHTTPSVGCSAGISVEQDSSNRGACERGSARSGRDLQKSSRILPRRHGFPSSSDSKGRCTWGGLVWLHLFLPTCPPTLLPPLLRLRAPRPLRKRPRLQRLPPPWGMGFLLEAG